MREFSLIIFSASFWALNVGYKCGHHDLKCKVDYVKQMTCCWSQNVSHSDPACEVQVTELNALKNEFPKTCSPGNKSYAVRSCNFKMVYFAAAHIFNVTLLCSRNGSKTEVARIRFIPRHNIQFQPPYNFHVVNNTETMTELSWQTSHEILFFDKMEFEIQYKLENEPWKDAQKHQIQHNERRMRIDSSSLKPDSSYVTRIRVKICDEEKDYRSTWSKWSQELKWKTKKSTSAAYKLNTILSISLSLSGTLFVVAVLAIRQLSTRRSRKKTFHWLSVPDPGKFFNDLNSTYNGNFQKWLGTKFPASFSSTEELGTEISSVEISEMKDPQSFLKENLTSDSSGFKSIGDLSMSSFANQGYFWFDYPSSYEAYPCKVYFSYHQADLGVEGKQSESYRCLTSSDDSLFNSSLQGDPFRSSPDKQGSVLNDEGGTGGNPEEEIGRPPGEHEGPTLPPYPDHPASCSHTSKEGYDALNPTFGSSDWFFGPQASLVDTKDESTSRFGSEGLMFEKVQAGALPSITSPCSQESFTQQNPNVFKTTSLDPVQSTDAYLSLKEVQNKYSNQSI
ncbi:interleukin-2 receptor subunit beta [Narcine bancroftii]|uniref:interleukin-2 receptor subunit beta n=1 Tax=Narcine bancroftii TaxID=1343680 RepID=UPI003831FFDD